MAEAATRPMQPWYGRCSHVVSSMAEAATSLVSIVLFVVIVVVSQRIPDVVFFIFVVFLFAFLLLILCLLGFGFCLSLWFGLSLAFGLCLYLCLWFCGLIHRCLPTATDGFTVSWRKQAGLRVCHFFFKQCKQPVVLWVEGNSYIPYTRFRKAAQAMRPSRGVRSIMIFAKSRGSTRRRAHRTVVANWLQDRTSLWGYIPGRNSLWLQAEAAWNVSRFKPKQLLHTEKLVSRKQRETTWVRLLRRGLTVLSLDWQQRSV